MPRPVILGPGYLRFLLTWSSQLKGWALCCEADASTPLHMWVSLLAGCWSGGSASTPCGAGSAQGHSPRLTRLLIKPYELSTDPAPYSFGLILMSSSLDILHIPELLR